MEIVKFLRTPFLQNTSGRLFLHFIHRRFLSFLFACNLTILSYNINTVFYKHHRFIANSVKHLRWSFLRKQITAKYSSIFLQKIFIIYIRQTPKYATYEIQKETGNHLISMYAKLSVKLTISYPLIRTRR